MANWIARQYNDIKGNAKWALLAFLWTSTVAAMRFVLAGFSHLPNWATWTFIGSASAIAFIWVAKWQRPGPTVQTTAQELATKPAVPVLPSFNFDIYFRLSHTSQLTYETERDVKALVAQQHPSDQVETLAKFIGIALWARTYEMTWAYIFRNQLLALIELNRRGGLMPVADIQVYYDRASHDNPQFYLNYPLWQWIDFMVVQALLIRHPSDMIEITVRGKDFLKYLTHQGWTADMRAN